jgi:ATPase subunit of ABC transporter with duplicated ATPase domains
LEASATTAVDIEVTIDARVFGNNRLTLYNLYVMIISVDIDQKSFGSKVLYKNLAFDIQPGEKIGLIGRNGTGKSTLLHMITGEDTDYQGEIVIKRGTILVSSRQEHHAYDQQTVLRYIQGDLPEFQELHHIITTYPEKMAHDIAKMQRYSDAIERFGTLGYYEIEEELTKVFNAYQLDAKKLESKLGDLSGGEKRMVELIKVQRSRGDIALIDEPTNHMDYVAKQAFMKWMKAAQEAILVVTHDRDVLGIVDRIVEIRDGKAYTFRGNYDQYLRINKSQTSVQVNEYDQTQRRIANLKNDVIRFRRLKEKSRDPGTIRRFKHQEEASAAELRELSGLDKPSFWIDRESAEELNTKMAVAYTKYKSKNISLRTKTQETNSMRLLVQATNLSLGYGEQRLFEGISFSLHEGERIRFHGRNGAGKTTLVRAIMAKIDDSPVQSTKFHGSLAVEREVKVGLYEQEIDARYLPMSLSDAIEQVAREADVPISDQRIKQILSDYLFNPATDGAMPIDKLSGGQKARFQIIRMLINDPQVLILDEPTNHLDLPSIEELEDAMEKYSGAVIYISHDSYFADRLKGEVITIGD